MLTCVNPAARSWSRYCRAVTVPVVQPACRSASLLRDDVADAQPAARPQHAERLRQHPGLVRRQVDHAVGDHRVDEPLWQRDILDAPAQELRVQRDRGGGVRPGQADHLRSGVQAVDPPGRAHPPGRKQHIEAAAGPQVKHRLPGAQHRDGQLVAAAKAGPQRRLGHQPGRVTVSGRAEAALGGTAVGKLLAGGGRLGQPAIAAHDRGADLLNVIGHEVPPNHGVSRTGQPGPAVP